MQPTFGFNFGAAPHAVVLVPVPLFAMSSGVVSCCSADPRGQSEADWQPGQDLGGNSGIGRFQNCAQQPRQGFAQHFVALHEEAAVEGYGGDLKPNRPRGHNKRLEKGPQSPTQTADTLSAVRAASLQRDNLGQGPDKDKEFDSLQHRARQPKMDSSSHRADLGSAEVALSPVVEACRWNPKPDRWKLQNKPLGRKPQHSVTLADGLASAKAALSPTDERLLRLSLAALGNLNRLERSGRSEHGEVGACRIEKTVSIGAASTAVSTISGTPESEADTSVRDSSLLEATSCSTTQQATLTQPQDISERRCGIDIGGVCAQEDSDGCLLEVPGASQGVRSIVEEFGGPCNVFLVSKVKLGGKMHRKTMQWLRASNGFLRRTGILEANVVFVEAASGRNGKGVVAARLGLSHFIDDRWDVLQSVFSDTAGNSGNLVRHFDGVLFQFACGGTGRWMFRPPSGVLSESGFQSYYCAVSSWSDVTKHLRRRFQTSLRTVNEKVAAVTRSIQVEFTNDYSHGLVRKLLGPGGENLRFVAEQSGGPQVFLSGSQQSLMQMHREPLAICISAANHKQLEVASELVADLLATVRRDRDWSEA